MSVWNDVKHIVEAAAAKAQDGRPCATMNGKGGAGSCVKMYLFFYKVLGGNRGWGMDSWEQPKMVSFDENAPLGTHGAHGVSIIARWGPLG